jgi:hypothetical protein
MDGVELARQLYVWYQHEFGDVNARFYDLSRERNRVRVSYKSLTQIMEFEGDEGGKRTPSKPFLLNVYAVNVGDSVSGQVIQGIRDRVDRRREILKTGRRQVNSDSRKDLERIRKEARLYDKIFKKAIVGTCPVCYEGSNHNAVKISVPMKLLPRGKGGSISSNLFECARREIWGVSDSAIRNFVLADK